ncbi:MAG: penicillin-binding protein [Patescibacteria group bacterium]|jgi:penicillin-binding protein 1C
MENKKVIDVKKPKHGHQTKEFAQKKKKISKRKLWLKRLGIAVAICFALGVIFMVGVFAWFSKDLPDPNKIGDRLVAESTIIFDKTGNTLLYEAGKDIKRTSTKPEEVPDLVKWATIDVEDKNFYNHPGFDWRGMLRSAGINFVSDKTVGGSTLTQQFIKQAIVGGEKKYTRKIKELILAIQLEKKYSKDEILTMYLNEINYGGVNYGIAAAANSYYGKKPSELTLAEAATLAGIPQRPTTFISDMEKLKVRRDYVLDQMVEQGHATKEEADKAKEEVVNLEQAAVYKKAPHFVDYVITQLEDDFGPNFMNQGLKVTTTLDWDKQQLAEKAIADNMDLVRQYGGSNAGLVNIDTKTGQVLAMVGSYDYYADDYDGQVNVAIANRQPGSSFKPIAYYTAFSRGYTPNTVLFDLTTTFPIESGSYTPHNYSGSTSGPLTMQQALGRSLNIPAVKTLYLAGLNNVLDVADSLGYTTFSDRSRYGLALVLGGGEVKLLEHTSAFATLAREGVRHPVATIIKVENKKGDVLYEWKNQETQVLDQASAQNINQVLSTAANRGGMFQWLNIKGHTVAAKTGTTQEFHDAWTMGYTPSFAVGVWVGNNDNSAMKNGADGSIVAAPIWNGYFSQILNGTEDEKFNTPPPKNPSKPVLWGDAGTTVKKKVDKITKKIIPDECLASYPAEYIEEKEFKEVHTILYYVNKDEPNGPAPKSPQSDPMFSAWEGPIQAWAKNQPDYYTEETEKEKCDLRATGQKPTMTISYPTDKTFLNNSTFSIKISYTVGSNRQATKVVYYIDNNVIDTKTAAPFATSYKPDNLTTGSHTLKVAIFDNMGDEASASVSFTFTNIKDGTTPTNSNTNSSTNKNTNTNTNENSNTNKKKKN